MLILLTAVDLGLGALLFAIFAGEQDLMDALGVPAGYRPIGAIAVGHPSAGERSEPGSPRAVGAPVMSYVGSTGDRGDLCGVRQHVAIPRDSIRTTTMILLGCAATVLPASGSQHIHCGRKGSPRTRLGDRDLGAHDRLGAVSGRPAVSARHVLTGPRWLARLTPTTGSRSAGCLTFNSVVSCAFGRRTT